MYYFCIILYIFYNITQFGQSQEVITQDNLILNEGSILHINFTDLGDVVYETCGNSGRCESQGKPNMDLQCKIVNETEGNTLKQYIDVTSKTKLSADYAGNWRCTFLLQYTTPNRQTSVTPYTATFVLPFTNVEEIIDHRWIYIVSTVVFLVILLIIIAQTMIILHFKKKARRLKRNQSMQSSGGVDTQDGAVRYTKMPVQVKMEQSNKETRESVIYYEALETYPISKPEPPPIDTLPRPNKTKSETEKTSLPRKPLPPPTPKKPVKNKNIDKHKDDTLSAASLERIKSRKPQPLPAPIRHDEPEMYEVMTPPENKNTESSLSRALPGKGHLPAQAVPVFPTGNNVPVLPSMIAAAQLKPVTVKKPNKAIVPPNKQKQQSIPEPKKTAPFVLDAIKKTKPAAPVFRKPPAPLPIQPIPENNGSISSDEEEWTYEPLSQYNIYDNVPR